MCRLGGVLELLLLPTLALAQRRPIATFQPREENETDYPDHPDRVENFNFCGACHGFRVIAAQGMTRAHWDASLTWMSERHSMPALDKMDRNLFLDYLRKSFPQTAPASGRFGWRNPFAPQ